MTRVRTVQHRRSQALAACVLACAIVLTACTPKDESLTSLLQGPTASARAARLHVALADADSTFARGSETPLAQWLLPHGLKEISGLALTSDGRLLVHDDEVGVVWEIDYRRGVIVKRFSLGKGIVKGDFEGITVANGTVFLLASNGRLYAFPEGANGAEVNYKVYDTGLKAECEFEGVAFDSLNNALLMACKHVHTKELHGVMMVIYRWSLAHQPGDTTPGFTRLAVPLAKIVGENGWTGFHPSDITVDPFTGNYVLISALEKGLVEITPSGALVSVRALPRGHDQPEGIAITKDSLVLISDEAKVRPGMITLYRWP